MMDIVSREKDEEGLRLKVYKCPAGKWTLGYGRNVEEKGISTKEADFLLLNDLDESVKDLRSIFPNFDSMNGGRQSALIDMRLNMGYGTFRKFKKTIGYVLDMKWTMAAIQVRNSKYYKQLPKRAEENAVLLEWGGDVDVLEAIEGLRESIYGKKEVPIIRKASKIDNAVNKVIEKTDGKKTETGIIVAVLGGIVEILPYILPETKQFIPENAGNIIVGGGGFTILIGIIHKYVKYMLSKGVKT